MYHLLRKQPTREFPREQLKQQEGNTVALAFIGAQGTPTPMTSCVQVHSTILTLLEALEQYHHGILSAYHSSPFFHLRMRAFPQGELDITAFDVSGWERFGFHRRSDVIARPNNQLMTISFGDNGYPISYSLDNEIWPIVERIGAKEFHFCAKKEDIKPVDTQIEQCILLAHLPLAQKGQGVQAIHTEQNLDLPYE